MAARAAVAGLATTSLLAAVLGSPVAQDAAADAENQVLGRTLTSFPSWDAGSAPSDLRWSIVIRLAVLAVATAPLCALAGRSASRSAALLAGWAAAVVAAAVAGAAAYAYLDATLLSGGPTTASYLDRLVGAANTGAGYGLWTGWLVGAAVAAVARKPRIVAAVPAVPRGATPPRGTVIADPPPPWWAPSEEIGEDGEPTLRAGPAVYEPGRMPPVVAGLGDSEGDTHVMSTVSGDPHPSDPDATQAVGLPAREPDATEVDSAQPGEDDATLHLPRQD